jgi:hypothetical protein
MADPSEKLAKSLESLKLLQDKGRVALRSSELSRTDRERLLKNGFIREVMKGWFIPTSPDTREGDSTPWYTAFWSFCSQYLEQRFGEQWSLSPENSLSLHAGNWVIPKQLMIRADKGGNNLVQLIHSTSLIDILSPSALQEESDNLKGIRVYSAPAALARCGKEYYRQNPIDARGVLLSIADSSQVLPYLLDGGKSVIAGRLAGAFRNIGRIDIATDIMDTFKSLDYQISESDPFESVSPILSSKRSESAYASRIRLMWQDMREDILDIMPHEPGLDRYPDEYLERVDEIFVDDAYNSLSIEGYLVTGDLIEKVRHGQWDPDGNESDLEQRNALAARGYWEAFKAVKESIKSVLNGNNPGVIVRRDHSRWYRVLFSPSVTAGILKPTDLAGYRNMPVYIRGSMHTPLNVEAVRDSMPTLFELLEEEPSAAVRAVLGHFLFVYIHPYMDGNGRTARFLMNTMLASGGYEWTVIPVERRGDYMASLEQASVYLDIKPFANFVSKFTHTNGVL